MREREAPQLAVLIDADNVPEKYCDVLFEEIASFGEASIRRIYGDFSHGTPQGWTKERLAARAILPHQQFANTVGKNASDIALVIDAMDILHSGRFDGFVLVSSDSDFTRLASRIREQGLDVFGFGENKTPDAFRKACKRFILLENLFQIEGPENGANAKVDRGKHVRNLILAAMEAADPEAIWVHLGQLGQQLNAANPEFDPRNFGCKNLSTLAKNTPGIEVKQIDGVLKVRRKV